MGYSRLKKHNGLTFVKKVYHTTENRDLKWKLSLHDCLVAWNVSLIKNISIFIKKKRIKNCLLWKNRKGACKVYWFMGYALLFSAF